MQENPPKIGLVVYADGSSRPNPGFGGYGLFGYSYKHSQRPKNTKHPIKTGLNFTSTGFDKDKGEVTIEVMDIYEGCIAIQGQTSTNNIAELKAAIHALEWAMKMDSIHHVLIITDSSYVVNNYNQNLKAWRARGFTKQGGEALSNEGLWRQVSELSEQLLFKDVQVQMHWVRGHDGDYGNEVADTYSVIASNAARVQSQNPNAGFLSEIINKATPYSEFKTSYQNKDVVYYFKHVYFSSADINDDDHCLVSAVEDDTNTGKRVSDAIFGINKGHVPKLIKDLRQFYRSISRGYVCTCSIHLKRFEDRDILRVAESVDVRFLLVPVPRSSNTFCLVNEPGVFLQENIMDFPFIVSINKIYNAMIRMNDYPDDGSMSYDVNHLFMHGDKVKLTTKDKFIDLQDTTKDAIVFTQKPVMRIGYDTPNYLTLKRIEPELENISVIFEKAPESNFYTLYTKIKTKDRSLCTVNMIDKYLAVGSSAPIYE